MNASQPTPPNTIPWPPIIVAGSIAAALILERLVPLGFLVPSPFVSVGASIMAAGLLLDVAAMRTMHRYRVNILPHRAATGLVTAWPFSMSRNPIYLGNTIVLAGAALAFRNPWFLALAAGSAWTVTHLAIQREERHLAALFGPKWDDYADRVPRWLRVWP